MEKKFITIVGQKHYYGMKPFKIGQIVKLVKEEDNEVDTEAIRVALPFIGTIGYVGNSPFTVYQGTNSAGRIYDKFEKVTYARIMFITHSSVIAEIDHTLAEEFGKCDKEEEKILF